MEKDKLSNAILVLRCQRRDEAAFRELVNRWQEKLYYYLRRIIENENTVWDVLQETWLAVFQSIRSGGTHFLGYCVLYILVSFWNGLTCRKTVAQTQKDGIDLSLE